MSFHPTRKLLSMGPWMCWPSLSLVLSFSGDIVALTRPDLGKSPHRINPIGVVIFLCNVRLHIRDYEEEAPWSNRNEEKHSDDGATNGIANNSA